MLKPGAIIVACFAGGLSLGSVDAGTWQAIARQFNAAYMSHYLRQSGAGAERYVYNVISDNQQVLVDYAERSDGVTSVETTAFPSLYSVHLEAYARQRAVLELRRLQGVSAVFTIPFICH